MLEVFIRREDAERFIEEVRGDDPELASDLRIEERELEASAAQLAGRSAAVTAAVVLAARTTALVTSGEGQRLVAVRHAAGASRLQFRRGQGSRRRITEVPNVRQHDLGAPRRPLDPPGT